MKSVIFFLAFLTLCACAHDEVVHTAARAVASSQSPSDVEGIWSLQGSNSARGPYTGEMELRRGNDGTYNVTRIVNYISFYFEGLRVQEVWTGKAVPNSDGLVISYELLGGDFVTELSGVKRKPENFKSKTTVNEFFRLNAKEFLEATFSDKGSATYQEWMATKRLLEAAPIWSSQRTKVSAEGQRNLSANATALLKSTKSQLNFDRVPFVQNYSKRADFKNAQAFVISDTTDYDFYQKNSDKIRLVNKSIDSISLIEAFLRRGAYVFSLSQKATNFEKNLQARHINEQGLVSAIAVEDNGQNRFVTSDDNGFLSGMYIAAQAMRFQKTKDADALENIKKMLPNFLNLLDAKEPTKEFHLAVEQALLWASLSVPKTDVAIWNKLREKAGQWMNSSVGDAATAVGLAAFIHQDPALTAKAHELYLAKLNKKATNEFYWKGTADWDYVFSTTLQSMTDIQIADLLQLKDIKEALQKRILDSWVLYSPAQRHLLTIAAYGFAFAKDVRSENFKRDSSDEKMRQALQQAAWGLRQIPQPRPVFDLNYDHSLNPEWSVSPVPRNFWSYKKGTKEDIGNFYQGLYELPLYEATSIDSIFVWKEPAFGFKGRISKAVENTGVDYLYAYWLAQYTGVIDDQTK